MLIFRLFHFTFIYLHFERSFCRCWRISLQVYMYVRLSIFSCRRCQSLMLASRNCNGQKQHFNSSQFRYGFCLSLIYLRSCAFTKMLHPVCCIIFTICFARFFLFIFLMYVWICFTGHSVLFVHSVHSMFVCFTFGRYVDPQPFVIYLFFFSMIFRLRAVLLHIFSFFIL